MQGNTVEHTPFDCTGPELRQAATEERTGKATDADDFSGSMLKSLSEEQYNLLAEVINNELNRPGELSSSWNEVIFTMIPNPGSTYPDTHVKAWRNIAGYSGMTKLVERVPVNRLKTEMEEAGWKLDSALMGGIPGKGVDDAAHNLGVLLGNARRHERRICGMSVDIRKAFDRERRDILWARSRAKLPDSRTIEWFERLYENPHGKVHIGKGFPETTFPLTRGLKQGSHSSPFLFTVMTDLILTDWRAEVQK